MDALVSVIVPFYNNENYIEKCLKSILDQHYRCVEVIAVDDGSKDSSLSIAMKIAGIDDRIKVLHQENSGVTIARNTALNAANGKYVLFVDGDDYIGENYIYDLVSAAEQNKSEMVFCGYTLVDEYEKHIKEVMPKYYSNLNEIWAYRISAVCSRLYNLDYLRNNNIKFVLEKNSRGEDIPVALFTNATAKNICMVQNSQYYYVQHDGSAMNSGKKVLFEFPYKSFLEAVKKAYSSNYQNNLDYLNVGILKALAQFDLVIYRRATDELKTKMSQYIITEYSNIFKSLVYSWKKVKKVSDIPISIRIAINVFVWKYSRLVIEGENK